MFKKKKKNLCQRYMLCFTLHIQGWKGWEKQSTQQVFAVPYRSRSSHSIAMLGRRCWRKKWDCSRLHSHSKAVPRIKTDTGMPGNQSRKQGNACSRDMASFHFSTGKIAVKHDALLTRATKELQLPNHNSAALIYQENLQHHFPTNIQKLQGNCKCKTYHSSYFLSNLCNTTPDCALCP